VWRIKAHKNERLLISTVNLPAMFASVISKNMATIKELQGYYSMEDVLDMYEIILVDNYNNYVLNE
jgi:hypothetical protein